MVEPSAPEKTDVFQLMHLRPANALDPRIAYRNYIKDEYVIAHGTSVRQETQFHLSDSPSVVGRIVYTSVFCSDIPTHPLSSRLSLLIDELVSKVPLPAYRPYCGINVTNNPPASYPLPERYTFLEKHEFDYTLYYVMPDRPDAIASGKDHRQLLKALLLLENARSQSCLDRERLIRDLEIVLRVKDNLDSFVFTDSQYDSAFFRLKRSLFDSLYILYILGRDFPDNFPYSRPRPINLDQTIRWLRLVHVLEALAYDVIFERVKKGAGRPSDINILGTIVASFPELYEWDRKSAIGAMPIVQRAEDLDDLLSALPIVHPIFARLFYYEKPFNNVTPIGIGDLKVVKQWLKCYRMGEIAHIHNIMKGELKERTHRHLEKTEQTVSFTSEQQEETTKDTQTTERFEIKRDAESIIKADLNLNTQASLQYGGTPLTVTLSAGVAYNQSKSEQIKNAQSYSREVVSKAITRIQTRTAQQRSITTLFETEETNKHVFSNVGEKHVSGIYRWLDKQYTAQLYNYGRRMMYEFIIPEPAAFYVESRIRHYESTLDCPPKPEEPQGDVVKVIEPEKISESEFNNLRLKYDLEEFRFPEEYKDIAFVDQGLSYFDFDDPDAGKAKWYSQLRVCELKANKYELVSLSVYGWARFHGKRSGDAHEFNRMEFIVDKSRYFQEINENEENWVFFSPWEQDLSGRPHLLSEKTTLEVGFQDVWKYHVFVVGRARRTQGYLRDWQNEVFRKIYSIEQKKVDEANSEKDMRYKSALATYENRLAEIKAQAINELLQGQSEAFNREIILTELKKACLAVFTKEFDDDPSGDILTESDAIGDQTNQGRRVIRVPYRALAIREEGNPTPPPAKRTVCTFDVYYKSVTYPSIKLDEARKKGRYIQFLEQAFEWSKLAYIFYPYFWAAAPKWIDLMNRVDDADPFFTAFLKAGSARVLVAVTPGYDCAVSHFIETREPWNGGPSPVIGNPLFIPLYEEIRKQQDDLANAVAEGEPWTFTLPTSLVYLDKSDTQPDCPP